MPIIASDGDSSGEHRPLARQLLTPRTEADELEVAAQDVLILDAGGRVAVGKHGVSLQADVLRVEYDGELTLDHNIRIHRIVQVLLPRYPGLYFLGIVIKEGPISAEALRWIISWNTRHQAASAAVVGSTSAVARALGSLVVRTINLFRKAPLGLKFCSSEEQAHAFFEKHRQQRSAPRHS